MANKVVFILGVVIGLSVTIGVFVSSTFLKKDWEKLSTTCHVVICLHATGTLMFGFTATGFLVWIGRKGDVQEIGPDRSSTYKIDRHPGPLFHKRSDNAPNIEDQGFGLPGIVS
ncbi:hypothetical protein L596_023192 [Steinernema carpocapsae]|uniref:Uncharacterized protein n=1 Tax=Steinernema carpocapsae TaxID=34508 RepID=A0A4U5MD47_STECR|nr:hypothetical protein L596_023192 [Steinernema carpocapsae]